MIEVENLNALFAGQKVYPRQVLETKQDAGHKKVVVVYAHTASKLPEPVSTMLNKLIGACKISLDQVKFINTIHLPLSFSTIQLNYSPEYLLIFGETAIEKNFGSIRLNEAHELFGLGMVKSIALDKLVSSDKDKGALWKALQVLFKI